MYKIPYLERMEKIEKCTLSGKGRQLFHIIILLLCIYMYIGKC